MLQGSACTERGIRRLPSYQVGLGSIRVLHARREITEECSSAGKRHVGLEGLRWAQRLLTHPSMEESEEEELGWEEEGVHRPLAPSPKADGFPCMESVRQSIFSLLVPGFRGTEAWQAVVWAAHCPESIAKHQHQGFGSVLDAPMGLARAYRRLEPEGSPAGGSEVFERSDQRDKCDCNSLPAHLANTGGAVRAPTEPGTSSASGEQQS